MVLAHRLEAEVELVLDLVVDVAGDADAAGLGEAFEAGGDVDAVAEDVVGLDDDVADIDADAEADAPVLGLIRLASATPFWIATAHSTASTALPNSTRAPSPVSLTTRP